MTSCHVNKSGREYAGKHYADCHPLLVVAPDHHIARRREKKQPEDDAP